MIVRKYWLRGLMKRAVRVFVNEPARWEKELMSPHYRYQALNLQGDILATGNRLMDVDQAFGPIIIVDFKKMRHTMRATYPLTRYPTRNGAKSPQVPDYGHADALLVTLREIEAANHTRQLERRQGENDG